MNINVYLKSLVDVDNTIIIICDLNHTIIYMNEEAKRVYAQKGMDLMGKNLMDCHNKCSAKKIEEVIKWFKKDKNNNRVHTFFNEKQNKDAYMIALRDENKELIGYYEKHEFRDKDTTPFYDIFE